MKSVLYISNSKMNYLLAAAQVMQLVDDSRRWNASVGITGALVSTEKHFVQFIEGPATAIDDLLAKLAADVRHANMTVITTGHQEERHFDRWSLAYYGPDDFIDRKLRHMLDHDGVAANAAMAVELKASLLKMASYA